MAGSPDEVSHEFLQFSRRELGSELWPRICSCLDTLTEEQVWWRPNESSNSIGNLLLHLNGNVRQWILSGLGGADDGRNRPAEFAEREHMPVPQLRATLEATLKEADSVLASLDGKALLNRNDIQKHKDVTGLEAIYHVVEHFAMHYGQVVYITKLLTAEDLGFFRHLN